ncbi:ImmA/IrrE family metallo-endopeptidase [Providencia hangzhouensis]|uniref:ImmA/IrrE family metallo-endopeptidase n=1 Tax=Providencia rettgeri TaxID=587 RepID=A0AAJ4NI97_PRORE|nr:MULTISPECIES: ImmA/IrrE family metallo-endopeptidase [Providencia]HEM8344854.1 ImmA/IrrE family metallo-endopeptidase [Providencia stuartii]EHZ6873067.1 ImmA/IrrE family metallo-endopeptidase [Providencia rettgeri]ELR5065104.1 ImmA/IrrE family metallo-endopeptidase [Providencia rettgeri]ELR5164018.1 ImmA/IrrE family metallo-endopeptidase [Providencia rettgeri]MBJ9970030.1 ImmA/IrrE family metallo-endopeptidase [Providencia rettgeri]
MISKLGFSPDRVSPPGDTIIDLMDEHGITDQEFSKKIGLSLKKGQQLLSGDISLDENLAYRLQDLFDVSSDFWLRRESTYRKHITHLDNTNKAWLNTLPVRDMIKYGWIPKTSSFESKLKNCLNFFGINSVNDFNIESSPLVAFRKSVSLKTMPMSDLVWITKAKEISSNHQCSTWNKDKLKSLIPELRKITNESDIKIFIPRIRTLLATAGVTLVALPTPSGCRASGATCFFEPHKATLIVSFRYLTDDHFWFTLFHEIGHLILHDAISIRLEGETKLSLDEQEEKEADLFATNTLIPEPFQEKIKYFSARNWKEIVRISRLVGVSKGIILGHLQHIGNIPYSHLNRLKVRYEKDDIL